MIITQIEPQANHQLHISTKDRQIGLFDLSPYLNSEAFVESSN